MNIMLSYDDDSQLIRLYSIGDGLLNGYGNIYPGNSKNCSEDCMSQCYSFRPNRIWACMRLYPGIRNEIPRTNPLIRSWFWGKNSSSSTK